MSGHIGPPLRKMSSTAVPPGESQFSDFRRALPRETGVKRVETAGVYPFALSAWVRRPQRTAKCFGTETLLVLTSYGQERKI